MQGLPSYLFDKFLILDEKDLLKYGKMEHDPSAINFQDTNPYVNYLKVKDSNGNKVIAREFFNPKIARLLIENKNYLQNLMAVIKSANSSICIGVEQNGDVNVWGKISKGQLATCFYDYYKKGVFNGVKGAKDVLDQIITETNPFNENEKGLFEVKIDGTNYSVDRKSLIDFLMYGQSKYNLNKNFIFPQIPKNQFFYILKEYLTKENVAQKYIFPNNANLFIQQILNDQFAITEHFNKYLKVYDEDITKFKINSKLKNQVLDGMPKNFSLLEKATYIYIRLCQILTYDAEFFAVNQSGEAAKKHKDINRLSQITPQNCNVVCYEFNELYAKFLWEMGINYDIESNALNYGTAHAGLSFRVDDVLVIADSTFSILGGDMFSAKVGEKLRGFNCNNKSTQINQKFDETFNRVYSYILKNVKNPYLGEDAFEHFKNMFNALTDIQEVKLDIKKQMLIKKCNTMTLPGMDKISYILKFCKNVFDQNKQKNQFSLSIVRQNMGEDMPVVVFAFNENSFLEPQKTEYVLYNPQTSVVQTVSAQFLKNSFLNGTMAYISDTDHKIPNILSGGKESVK